MTSALDLTAYVVGIVAAGTQLPDSDSAAPFTRLRLVESGALAAVVVTPPADRSLGRAQDLLAHDRLLAELVAAGTPVVPLRFGTVMSDDDQVVSEVLDASLEALLAEVTDRVQYTVKVRFEQDAVLSELLREEPEIRRLRELAGTQESFDVKLRLGQLVVEALDRRRPAVADDIVRELGDEVAMRLHETSAPEDVLSAAFLVERGRIEAFEAQVERVAEHHAGLLRVRLVGPTAAYDFVGGR